MAMTIVENNTRTVNVTGGVDTHADFHVAAAVDANGGVLGIETFETTTGAIVVWFAGWPAPGSSTRSGLRAPVLTALA